MSQVLQKSRQLQPILRELQGMRKEQVRVFIESQQAYMDLMQRYAGPKGSVDRAAARVGLKTPQ